MTKRQQFLIDTVSTIGELKFHVKHGLYDIKHYKYNEDLYSVLFCNNVGIDICLLN